MIKCNLYLHGSGKFIITLSFYEIPKVNESIHLDGFNMYYVTEVRHVFGCKYINSNTIEPITDESEIQIFVKEL